nr:integrase family protein [Ruegeria sp. HKCCC2117]
MIEGLALTDKGQVLWWFPPEILKGFGVLCGKTSKSYVVQAKITVNGRRRDRRVTIGTVGVWTLDDALAKGRELLRMMEDGIDPKAVASAAEADAEVEGWTLKSMLERVRRKKGAGYGGDVERWLSDWMDLPAEQITGRLVNDRYHWIIDDVKARRGTSGITSANKVMRELKAIWNYIDAIDEELGRNPVRGLKHDMLPTPTKSDRIPSDGLAGFWREIWAEPFEAGRDLVIFLLLTGMRRGVGCSLAVDEWDSRERVLRVAGERMKSGRSFEVPVSAEIAAMLDRRAGLSRHGYIFEGKTAGRGKRRVSDEPWVKEPRYVLDRVGGRCGWKCSVHGLRRTMNSEAIGIIDPTFRKILMAHSLGGEVNEANYSVVDVEALRPAAQAVTDRLIGYAEDADEVRGRIQSGAGCVPDWKAKAAEQLDRNLVEASKRANDNSDVIEAALKRGEMLKEV